MKLVEFNGLSGRVAFDTQGLRTQFFLDVMELQLSGLEPIGKCLYIVRNDLEHVVVVVVAGTNWYTWSI